MLYPRYSMVTKLFYIFNCTGIEYDIRNYYGRNIGTDGNLNFTLNNFIPKTLIIFYTILSDFLKKVASLFRIAVNRPD